MLQALTTTQKMHTYLTLTLINRSLDLFIQESGKSFVLEVLTCADCQKTNLITSLTLVSVTLAVTFSK